MQLSSASICICTYNRAERLRETLAALQAMIPPPDCDVEIVVVDNNSIDDTREVVIEAKRAARYRVVYVHESRQGKSFALNTALDFTRGDVLALTDDDVVPAADWLARIVRHFREQDVTFVFGKVLPRWAATPPPELLTPRARDVWGPLALVDYGDTPVEYVAESTAQQLPIGANLAFLKSALIAIGGWRTDLGKVNNTLISGEDHEIFIRLRRLGLYAGFYDPELTVRHYVPAARLTRRYFRRWFYWHGKTQALMLDDLFPTIDMTVVPRIAGVPRFLYRDGLRRLAKYVRTATRHSALDVLIEELHLLQFVGLYIECWRRAVRIPRLTQPQHATVARPCSAVEIAVATDTSHLDHTSARNLR
jgi:glucosyl-dolichyl phosphate glucuronosyltransferase